MSRHHIFSINIELYDGKNERIDYNQDDNPEELAFEICRRRGLNNKIFHLISSSIREKLSEYHEITSNLKRNQNRPSENQTKKKSDLSPNKHEERQQIVRNKSDKQYLVSGITDSITDTQTQKDGHRGILKNGIDRDAHRKSPFFSGYGISEDTKIHQQEDYEHHRVLDKRMESPARYKSATNVSTAVKSPSAKSEYGGEKNRKAKEIKRNNDQTRSSSNLSTYVRDEKKNRRLYDQGMNKIKKKQLIMDYNNKMKEDMERDSASFTPSVNPISTIIFNSCSTSKLPFHKRLTKVNTKSSSKNEEGNQDRDRSAPNMRRSASSKINTNTHNRLYKEGQDHNKRIDILIESDMQKIKNASNTNKSAPSSMEIYNKMINSRSRSLFFAIDIKKRGVIDGSTKFDHLRIHSTQALVFFSFIHMLLTYSPSADAQTFDSMFACLLTRITMYDKHVLLSLIHANGKQPVTSQKPQDSNSPEARIEDMINIVAHMYNNTAIDSIVYYKYIHHNSSIVI